MNRLSYQLSTLTLLLPLLVQAFEPVIVPMEDTLTSAYWGFRHLGEEQELFEPLEDSTKWVRGESGGKVLSIFPEMHGGSSRSWTITVGVNDSSSLALSYASQFMTSTIGWRTLQNFEDSALPWVEDVDKDGNDEIIIWSSFLAFETGTNADFGLIAWVYDLDSTGTLRVNIEKSKQILNRVAQAYEKPLAQRGSGHDSMSISFQKRRSFISELIRSYLLTSD